MTNLRPLATTLILSFSALTSASADIIILPSRPGTNEAFDITVTGGFLYDNSVTGQAVSVTTTNINIDMYAPTPNIIMWVPTLWNVTNHIPPLAAGDYLITAVLHGGIGHDDGYTQTAYIRITRSPFIDSVAVDSSQPTYPPPMMNLTFKGSTSSAYSIQSSIDLLTWTNEYDSLHMTNVPHTITFPMIGTSRYYRAVQDANP
jgi:hypothetical protein